MTKKVGDITYHPNTRGWVPEDGDVFHYIDWHLGASVRRDKFYARSARDAALLEVGNCFELAEHARYALS